MNLNLKLNELCTILNLEIPSQEIPADLCISNVVIDSRSPRVSKASLFIALDGVKDDGHNYLQEFKDKGGLLAIVKKQSDSLGLVQLVVADPKLALQELAKAHRSKFDYQVIGIAGSNGKTIVKEWLYHTLKEDFNIVRSPKSYNSQIGVALSILGMTQHHNLAIFEAGISAPGEMSKLCEMIQPTFGVFTGIGDAHASEFESNDHKRKEKFILFENVDQLINNEELDPLNIFLPFKDKASIANATTVYHAAVALKMSETVVKEKLATLPAVSMRLEQLQGANDCILINDAYTADLSALEIALSHLNHVGGEKKKVLFLSLSDEQRYFTEEDAFIDLIGAVKLEEVIFIGDKNVFANSGVDCTYYPTVENYLENAGEFKNAAILFKGSRQNNLERLVDHYAEKKHITQLEVNLSAMRNNLNVFRNSLEKGTKSLVMVKAQSYGTGMIEIAQFLQNEAVDYLGVAYADEGVELRKAGIELPILVMNPEKSAFDQILEYELEPSIYSMTNLQSFLHYLILKQRQGYPVHIKLDTGMNRLGFGEEELDELVDTLEAQPEVFVKSVFSHLAVADDIGERTFTFEQIRKFEFMTGQLMQQIPYPFERHLANSSGILNHAGTHFDMVRIGIGLYGLLPNHTDRLENVLTYTSEISQIKLMQEGESLGYGRTYVAGAPTQIAIIPVGYADGLRRGLSQGNWSMLINGKEAPVIGTICMDMCMVDITEIEASVGDRVQIFGNGNSIFEMARNLYTIPYEIISTISSRVHKVYLD